MPTIGTRGASPVWMVVAVVVIAGFFYWLYAQTRGLETQTLEPTLEESGDTVAQRFALEDLREDPEALIGETGWVDSVPVAGTLGRALFLIRTGDETYPVLLSPDLLRLGTQLSGGQWVSVYGHFFTLNDSIRAEWIERGAVNPANEGNVPGSPSFLLADSVRALM